MDIMNDKSLDAVKHYGDAATLEFYRLLKEKKLQSTRCTRCSELAFPPRSFCPSCWGEEVEWFDLPTRGTLYAFTQQRRTLRFGAPDVIGLVELPGVGRIFTRIDAPLESLSIGQEMELDFLEVSEDFTLHQFRPVGS